MPRIALPALALVLAACGGEAPETEAGRDPAPDDPETSAAAAGEADGPTDPTDLAYAPALGVDLGAMERRDSGLYVQVLEEGEGEPAEPGDSMAVHYTVWFPDGRKLDSSRDHRPPEPLPMVLGQTALIEGWTQGVTGMRLGERRRLVVPYDLAYGASGRPPQVPPYATLVFEVELAGHRPGSGG